MHVISIQNGHIFFIKNTFAKIKKFEISIKTHCICSVLFLLKMHTAPSQNNGFTVTVTGYV